MYFDEITTSIRHLHDNKRGKNFVFFIKPVSKSVLF